MGLPGYWAVLFVRAALAASRLLPHFGLDPSSPLLLFEKIYGLVVIAFAKNRTLGVRNRHSFRGHLLTAHTLAYLRFAGPVTGTVARFATGSGGLTPDRAGFAPARRQIEFHGVIAVPPIPIDQQSLVALIYLRAFRYRVSRKTGGAAGLATQVRVVRLVGLLDGAGQLLGHGFISSRRRTASSQSS